MRRLAVTHHEELPDEEEGRAKTRDEADPNEGERTEETPRTPTEKTLKKVVCFKRRKTVSKNTRVLP